MLNTHKNLNERLTLYILASEWIISILSLYISTVADKETVWQTKLPGLMIISYILMILIHKEFSSIIVRRNQMLVTLRGWRIKNPRIFFAVNICRKKTWSKALPKKLVLMVRQSGTILVETQNIFRESHNRCGGWRSPQFGNN